MIDLGPPPSEEAWRALALKLLQAGEVSDDETLPAGMNQVLAMLWAFRGYLQSQGHTDWDQLLGPMFTLMTATADLKKGLRPKLFEPTVIKGGRPPTPTARAVLMGIAARVVEEMVKAGGSPGEAAKRVCRELHARTPSIDDVTPRTVLGWRAGLRTGQGGGPDDALETFKMKLPPEAGATPASRVTWLLRELRWSPAF